MRRTLQLGVGLALACLALVPAAHTARPKPARGPATIDLHVALSRVDATRATGTATFEGTLRDGSAMTGTGSVAFRTALRGGRFRPVGTGTLRFTATVSRPDGAAARIRGGRASLPFVGGPIDGTGISWDDLTLSWSNTTDDLMDVNEAA